MGQELQKNKVSKLFYQGKNQMALLNEKELKGYNSNEWVTFLQARELNLKIKKGSKAVSVFKGFSTITEKNNKNKKLVQKSVPIGFAKVFNLEQTEKIS